MFVCVCLFVVALCGGWGVKDMSLDVLFLTNQLLSVCLCVCVCVLITGDVD